MIGSEGTGCLSRNTRDRKPRPLRDAWLNPVPGKLEPRTVPWLRSRRDQLLKNGTEIQKLEF